MNSASARFAPANVIVPPVAESKVTVPVPASHMAASVEAFVHVPEIVHVSEPKSMAEPTAEMLMLPEMTTLPDVLVKSPPLIVSDVAALLIVNVNVLLANVPPEMVIVASTTMFVASVTVPPEILSVPKALSVESRVMAAVASNVTVLVP